MSDFDEQNSTIQLLSKKIEDLAIAVEKLQNQMDRFENGPVKTQFSKLISSTLFHPTPKQNSKFFKPLPPNPLIEFLKKAYAEGNLLNKVGALTVILAIGMGFKVAMEYNLIGPTLRVLLGFILGGILFAVGESCQKKKWLNTASGLLGAGEGIFFLSIGAAQHLYHLISSELSFPLYILITFIIFAQAIRLDSEIICIMGLIGGFLSPALVSTGTGNYLALNLFLLLLNFTVFGIAHKKNWTHIKWLSFIFTQIYLISWGVSLGYLNHAMNLSHFSNTLPYFIFFVFTHFLFYFFLSIHRAIYLREKFLKGDIFLSIGNGALSFILLYWKLESQNRIYLGIVAIFMAFIFLYIAGKIIKDKDQDKDQENLSLSSYETFLGMGAWFLISAVPMICSGYAITLAWGVEGVLMAYLSTRKNFSYFFPHTLGILVILAFRLLFWDKVFNAPSFDSQLSYLPIIHDPKTIVLLVTALCSFFILKITAQSSLWQKASPKLILALFILFVLMAYRESYAISHIANQVTHPYRIHGFFDILLLGIISILFYLFLWAWKFIGLSAISIRSHFLNMLNLFLLFSFLIMFSQMSYYYVQDDSIPMPLYFIFGSHLISLFFFLPVAVGAYFLSGENEKKEYFSTKKHLYSVAFISTIGLGFLFIRYELRAALFLPPLSHLLPAEHLTSIFEMASSCVFTLVAFFLYLKGIKKQNQTFLNWAFFIFFASGIKIYLLDLATASQIYRVISLIFFGLLLLVCSYFAKKIQTEKKSSQQELK